MARENRTGLYDLKQEADLIELLQSEERKVALKIRTVVACEVVATTAQPLGFDPATQKVSVKIATRQVIVDQENPDKEIVQPPVTIQNVPVAFPRTGKGYVTFPIAVGDTGELMVHDRSTAKWLLSGEPEDPTYMWTHNLTDGVFHPGLHSDVDPITPPVDSTATVLDGDSLIKIGRLAQSFTVKVEILEAILDAFANAVPVPQDGGAAIQTAFKAAYLINKPLLASLKAQVE